MNAPRLILLCGINEPEVKRDFKTRESDRRSSKKYKDANRIVYLEYSRLLRMAGRDGRL